MLFSKSLAVLAAVLAIMSSAVLGGPPGGPEQQPTSDRVMLILRGIPNEEYPRGALDDEAAVEYAHRAGFRGEVLDLPADYGASSAQIRAALERIRHDETVAGIYGFSGGGYNARVIWDQLSAAERERIRKIVVVGSPGVEESQFAGRPDVLIKPDPPEGHMAGPKALLESIGP
jgi:hypothetical protein